MFTAIISTFISSLANISWKKSLGYGVGGKLHDLLTYPFGIIIAIYLVYAGINAEKLDYFIVSVAFIILALGITRTALNQKIYKEEKISAIIPYTNVNKILTIIASFFLFSDVSLTSLFITIAAIFVVIIFSIDFKNMKFPKSIISIFLAEFIASITTICSGYLILNYGGNLYFIIHVILGVLMLSSLSFLLDEFKTLKGLPGKFWLARAGGGLGWFSWFLSLIVIANLGLSVSILLSFVGIGVTLFLSYLILKDVPSKKNLILTALVTLLVGIGFYFK